MEERDKEKFYEPVYTTCKMCGVIVMADTPPQCSDEDCPFKEEWADSKLTLSDMEQNREMSGGQQQDNKDSISARNLTVMQADG